MVELMVEEVSYLTYFLFLFPCLLLLLLFCVNYPHNEFIYFAEGDEVSKQKNHEKNEGKMNSNA